MTKNIGVQLHDTEGNRVYPNPFPIGAIYMSCDSRNPSQIFGGTWEQIKDKFLLCAGSTYAAGSTGGEANHTLTQNEMPIHSHSQRVQNSSGYSGGDGQEAGTGWGGNYHYANSNSNAGGNQPHNNMPPFLAVYVWRRIA